MPTLIEVSYENDPAAQQNTMIFPGKLMKICAEHEPGVLSGVVTIVCQKDDTEADIYEEANPEGTLSTILAAEAEEDFKPRNLRASLGNDDIATIYLRDCDHGLMHISIRHSVLLVPN